MKFASVLAAATIGLAASLASAHFDFVPKIVNNQVATAGHDDEEGVDVSSLIVAGYDFGEIAADPYNIGDPGFNTQGASAFTASSTLRLAAQTHNGRYLSYWNGTGDPTFGSVPSGVSLTLAGSPSRYVSLTETSATYAPSSTPSLLIGTFSSNGAMHVHLTSSIFKDGDQVEDSVPVGAYLIAFELLNPNTGVANSEPLYIIFNNGLTEEVHDGAIDAFAASLNAIPEPASLGLLTLALPLLTRRR